MHTKWYKHYITGLLLVVYIFNQTDRSIFGVLMEPIRRELWLSDSELGFLAGPALAVLYAILGIPIARLADRGRRVDIIAVAVALWSVTVMLSATVHQFWQLAAVRVGVGIGEAGFSAIAQSLIGDYHSVSERPKALSVFMLAIPFGALLSNLLGGWANEVGGWRMAFFLAGLPGVALAFLVKFSIREPLNGSTRGVLLTDGGAGQPSFRTVFLVLWRRKSLRHLAIAMALINMACACALTWIPTFFIRCHGMATTELGVWLGLVTSVGGGFGTWLGGYTVSRYAPHAPRRQMHLVALAAALSAPCFAAVLFCPLAYPALLLLLPAYLLMFFYFGPSFSWVQSLSPVNVRSAMTATVILGQILLAGVVGVQLVGVLSDWVSTGNSGSSLRVSMALFSLLGLWAAVHFYWAGRSIPQDLTQMDGDQVIPDSPIGGGTELTRGTSDA